MRAEHRLLVGKREAAEERQYVGVAQLFAAQAVGGFADVAFAGEEDENVVASVLIEFGDGAQDGVRRVFVFTRRAVADFHRIGAPADVQHRRATEVGGEFLRVDGCRGDDDFEVGAARSETVQVAEEEVDVEAALVRLIDDDDFVLREVRVGKGFGEQHAVGHQFDDGGVAGFFVKTHLVANGITERRIELLGDARGDAARGDAARLGVGDGTACAKAEGETKLRQLCRLPRTGFAADDDDLMLADEAEDVVFRRQHRQVGGEFWLQQRGTARLNRGGGSGIFGGKAGAQTVGRLAAPLAFADLAVQLAQSMAVAAEDGGEIGGGHCRLE